MVDYNVIVKELACLGVQPVVIRWIKAFLSNREQCVRVGISKSSWKKTNGGLPQGTKLGRYCLRSSSISLLKDWPNWKSQICQRHLGFRNNTEILPKFNAISGK